MMSDINKLCNNYNPTIDNGLIIIADISGFTNYINISEIEHSQKNIAVLLEAIIDANILDLTVSEIEGDAIFFFKFSNNLSYLELMNQIKKMTNSFYLTLANLTQDKTCECGACSVLADLHIKFIIHIGYIGTIMVKEYCKLYGIDVIIANRLLKNHLGINDYILLTNKTVQKFSYEKKNKFLYDSAFIQEEDIYEDTGKIKYFYMPTKDFLKEKIL